MKTAKLGALFLISIMALAGVGASYAHWTDSLLIKGTIATGNIDPLFRCVCSNDPSNIDSDDPTGMGSWNYYTCTWTGDQKTKNVGSIDISKNGDETELTITAENTYPCYYGSVAYGVYNKGSVPVMLTGIKLTRVSGHTANRYKNVDVDLIPCHWYYVDVDTWTIQDTPLAGADFAIHISEGQEDRQIDPSSWGTNAPDTWYGDVTIHTQQSAHELANYDFTIKLLFENWT